jgi:hypothetical protein
LALLYCELDRDDEASDLFADLARSRFDLALGRTDSYSPVWGTTVTDCAAVAAHLGDTESAAVLLELIAPYAGQWCFPSAGIATGSMAHYLGMLCATLGDFGDAETHFAAAAATHTRMGAHAWLARTRLEWARMLLARAQPGDADRARDLLGHALQTARELGLGNVERRAVALSP